MVTWDEFTKQAPELAQLAEARFAATELVLLGTLRKNGWPRITPIEYSFFEGELALGSMWQSKKALDLLRDDRCVVHSTTSDKNGQQGDVKLYGRARPLAVEREEAYWQRIFEELNWRPDGPAHVFVVDIESAAYVRFDATGRMDWLTWPGNEWKTQAG
jgi:hypothetical protein